MKTSIVWFTTDLRINDNETLMKAISLSESVLPVYCFDTDSYQTTSFGFRKTGKFRAQFILESLKDLDQQLRKLGSGLLVVKGNSATMLSELVKKHQVKKVYAKKEVAFEEKQRQLEVEREIWKHHCTLDTYSTSTLYHAEDLPFSIKNIPDHFTSFRKKVEQDAMVRSLVEKPKKITSPSIEPLYLPTLKELGLETPIKDPRSQISFQGGETNAHQRMHYYFSETQLVSHYKETRNGLMGADYSSKFSPWLAQGCLSPRTIYYELKKYEAQFGANASTYWLIFELLWRDFFRFMFKKHGNDFFLREGIKKESAKTVSHNEKDFQRWKLGITGIDFIDANMKELNHTGFMSNRGRQNVASYLINDLKTDWRYGAAYFEEQLIDYDVCSNWGNWAYIAGVGNDPRDNRYFNTLKQANEYDAKGAYRKHWLGSVDKK